MISQAEVLTRAKHMVVQHISKELLADVEVLNDEFLDMFIIRTTKELLIKNVGKRALAYPDGWKEAFKERWLPEWLKKRFPVRYCEHDVLAVFPTLLDEHPIPQNLRNQNYYLTYVRPGEVTEC